MSLPQFVALRANFNYNQQFVAIVTEGSREGCLEVSSAAEILVSPKAKFAVELSAGGLVHIRSCYNNKYWSSESEGSSLIVATAVAPLEDETAWNCTLFRLEFSGAEVSFYHVVTNSAVLVKPIDNHLLLSITKGNGDGEKQYFTPVDVESIVKLPKRVTFKGNNGKYLRARFQEGHEYNEFSGEDGSEEAAHYEIFINEYADIYVKSLHYGKYWRRSPNWIWADSTNIGADNPDNFFEVIKIGDNLIALRNRGNDQFCKRLTTEGKESCLNAATPSIEGEARLVVEEPVVSRKVEVQFRLEDARILRTVPLHVDTITVSNKTPTVHEAVEEISYTETHVSTWSNSTSLTLGAEASFLTGIPTIAEGKLKVSSEISNTIQFGKSVDFSKKVKSEYKVPIPAMSKIIIKVLATQSNYDIPFSYIQTDRYSTGERVSTKLDDGIYHAVQAYDFSYGTTYEPL